MKQKINIKIENQQISDNETTSSLNVKEEGLFYEKNNFYYLVYEDHSEGLKGARTVIRIDPQTEEVFLMRKSPAEMKQKFIKNKKTEGIYKTPHGKLDIENKTNSLEFNITGEKGRIEINYDLFINGKLNNKNKLEILYWKRGDNDGQKCKS